jgi:hypothetical protein
MLNGGHCHAQQAETDGALARLSKHSAARTGPQQTA